ncbi:unnamed protein product [Blepharisma stoltei]|uniref:ACB domain-containing protein n=1 Tax=Blepharisma stoltei TaxID=1481888 RepID=A0AAU9KCQ3_9CILI|nr:unnamed protein product [Blepharisma stoltei]
MLLSMISSSPTFGNWDLTKQFMAAQFYLSQEKPLSLSETQRMTLGALHMQATYGPCIPGILQPDMQNYNTSYKRKWEEEWKKLGCMPRVTAMRKFLDFMHNIFPNWWKHPSLYTNFELEWTRNEISYSSISASIKNIKDISREVMKTHSSLSSFEPSSKQNYTAREGSRIHKRFSGYAHPMFRISDPSISKSSIGDIQDTISSLRHNTVSQMSNLSSNNNLLSIPTLEVKEQLKPRQASPVLKGLFEKFQSKDNKSNVKKKFNFQGQENSSLTENKSGLDACIDSIEKYLNSLEEKTYDKNEGTIQTVIGKAFNNLETEVIECLLRPKLELVGGILEELESKYREELNPKSEVIAKIREKYSETVNYIFDYIEKLDWAKTEMKEHSKKTEQQWNLLRQGINSIKELKDPANYKFNLFGKSKQSVGYYTDCLYTSRQGLPQEDIDILGEIEHIIEQHESKESSYVKEIEQRDLEISHLKQIFKETQQKSYKDNIDLSNQCRIMKESIELIQGKRETDNATEGILKRQIIELKLENERLKHEKLELFELSRK